MTKIFIFAGVMGFAVFMINLALSVVLVFSAFRRDGVRRWLYFCRIAVVAAAVAVFSYWFLQSSVPRIARDSMAMQVINSLPQPVDFYTVNIEKKAGQAPGYVTRHLGKIRPDYYRIDYLDMKNSDELWITGYIGKKNQVYFSQLSVPNKNFDQIIEVKNYMIQSQRLAAVAKAEVLAHQSEDRRSAVWVTLGFLLLFMNMVLIFRKR